MALRHCVHVDIGLDDGLPRMQLDVERFPHAEEEVVPRRAHDDAMEPGAVVDHGLEVAAPRRLAHAVEVLGDDAGRLVEARQRQPHRRLLERAADGVDLVLGPGVVVVDEGAAARADGDEAGLLEVAERLADGRLARPEFTRELEFDQPLAGPVVAGNDPFQELVADPDADRLVIDIRPPAGLRGGDGFHGRTSPNRARAKAVARLRRVTATGLPAAPVYTVRRD